MPLLLFVFCKNSCFFHYTVKLTVMRKLAPVLVTEASMDEEQNWSDFA